MDQTYKAPDGSLHVIDPEYAHYLPEGSVAISSEEAAAIRASHQAQVDPVQQVKDRIDSIERETLMNRAVREFMLAQAEQIAAGSGYTPEQLYIANTGYRRVKDIDNQIAALRAQIGAS